MYGYLKQFLSIPYLIFLSVIIISFDYEHMKDH